MPIEPPCIAVKIATGAFREGEVKNMAQLA